MPNPRTDQIAFMIFTFTILALFLTTIVMFSGCSVKCGDCVDGNQTKKEIRIGL